MAMNNLLRATIERMTVLSLILAVSIFIGGAPFAASSAIAATSLSTLWTAGGLSAGNDSAGQAARIATDASGNVAVVSGPSGGRNLAVTSYTASGSLRWQGTITPASGTFVGDWVAAAPNGDFLAVGHTLDSSGRSIQSTLVRYASNGILLWRVDPSVGFYPSVGRLAVDAAGNAYLAVSGRGTGMFLQKYSPSGALLWSQLDSTGSGYAIASSLALSPDGAEVAVTGSISGGATWITALYNAVTGARRWQVAASEGTAARDVVVDASRVYVTGQSVTGAGTPALKYHLAVIAYDRATGTRLWRSDKTPADGSSATGLWMAKAPDGSMVVAGQANRGFLDWYTVAFETTGAVRWEAVRDGGLNTDEVPAGVLVLADGTSVVTGRGGPNLPGGYWPGVTAGYSTGGTVVWEGFSALPTVWATVLPSGDVCATGGYDALITCFQVADAADDQPVLTASPLSGTAPLPVNFTASVATDPSGPIISYWKLDYGDGVSVLNFGDGTPSFAVNFNVSHTYISAGTYTAIFTVFYTNGVSLSLSDSVTITVSPVVEQPPAITATPVSGTVPLTVNFTSSAARNSPLINSYRVNYGDGTVSQFILNAGDGTTTFIGNSSHTYTAVGSYTAILTVAYNNATSASASVAVTVSPAVSTVLRSTAINLSATLQKNKVSATGAVVVKNSTGTAISGAVVSATWTTPGGSKATQTATTNSNGIVSFNTSGSRGTYTLKVNNISKTGYSFDSANSVLSNSITK